MSDLPVSIDESTSGTPQAPVEASRPRVQSFGSQHAHTGKVSTLRTRIAEAETQAILLALEKTDWNRKRAAQLLAISYRGLLYKIRRHNISRTK
jgi:DNA-binding NtrC family response regulator